MLSSDHVDNVEEPSEKQCEHSRGLLLPIWRSNCTAGTCITHLNVYLGSLTFTSEQLASSLAEKAKQLGVQVTVQSLDEFKPEQYLNQNSLFRVAVFVVSTHAAGKPAANAERFLLWLRKASSPFCFPTNGPPQVEAGRDTNTTIIRKASAPTDRSSSLINRSRRRHQVVSSHARVEENIPSQGSNWRFPFGDTISSKTANKQDGQLRGCHYAVFGVGNSIHRTYNATATYVDTRLQELGAVRVCALGLGDISKSIDSTFEKWESQLLQKISKPSDNSLIRSPIQVEVQLQALPLHRSSLPCATINSNGDGNEILIGETVKRGPTFADIELPCLKQQHQRRYSSVTSMVLARRGSFELTLSTTAVSPFSSGDRKD